MNGVTIARVIMSGVVDLTFFVGALFAAKYGAMPETAATAIITALVIHRVQTTRAIAASVSAGDGATLPPPALPPMRAPMPSTALGAMATTLGINPLSIPPPASPATSTEATKENPPHA